MFCLPILRNNVIKPNFSWIALYVFRKEKYLAFGGWQTVTFGTVLSLFVLCRFFLKDFFTLYVGNKNITQKKGENKVLTQLPEEERKILILKIVLNVSHLMIHSHKILLIHSSTLLDSKWNIRIITNIGPKSLFQNIVLEMHHFYNA